MTNWKDVPTKAAEGVPFYTPAQEVPAGTARDPQTNGQPIPKLFRPLKIRGTTFQNRLGVSPMCQYSAHDGHMTPWHTTHYGGIAQRGPGLIIVEATGVVPEGRITPGCTGLWADSQIEPMKQIVDFVHSQGQKIGIQLGHAGRKASTVPPWLGGVTATNAVGGWTDNVKAPSAIPFAEEDIVPKEMTLQDIQEVKDAWAAAVKRAIAAGMDFIEIHNAHGYLFSSFLDPASNQRTDQYGGSFENRIRLSLEIAEITRQIVGSDVPVFLRLSATDWADSLPADQRWTIQDTIKFAEALADQGAIDLIDVSTGGLHSTQKPVAGPAFQAPFAAAVKKAVGDRLLVASVGIINNGTMADKLLEDENIDLILVGRGFQKETGLVWRYAQELKVEIALAAQIGWGFAGRFGSGQYVKTDSDRALIY